MLDVLRSGRLSLGPTIERFEELIAERTGAPYAAAVSSGTAGLHLLARIAGLGPGDEAITSPFSFVASANCFVYRGRDAGLRRHRPAHAQPRPGGGRGGDHRAHEGDRRGRHLRLPLRARRAARARRATRPRADRRLVRGARRGVQGRAARLARPSSVFAFYPNKQIDDRRGRRRHDALAKTSAAAPEPAQPGALVRERPLAPPRRTSASTTARPTCRRPSGIAQLEKLDEILALRSEAAGALRRAARGTSTASRRRCPTTPTTAARGSSTSSCSTRASTGRASLPSSRSRGSSAASTSRASTCSRTCARRTASPRACARWPRTRAGGRSPCRSSRSSSGRTRSASLPRCRERSRRQ